MPSKKPPESEFPRKLISEHSSDWLHQFIKHLELNFLNTSPSLSPNASMSDYQNMAIRAMFQTLLDSGLSTDSITETIGQILVEGDTGSVKWNPNLNKRRFDLIDKEIQGILTSDEKIELAGLTKIMREQIESEINLPIKGARALHQKLLELDSKDNLH